MLGDSDIQEDIGANGPDAVKPAAGNKRQGNSRMPKELAAFLAKLNSEAATNGPNKEKPANELPCPAKVGATQEFAALIAQRFGKASSPAPISRKTGLRLAGLCFVPVLLGIAYLALVMSPRQPTILSGTIEAKEITMAPKVTGRVRHVLVDEGQTVKIGQPIVELALPELEARRLKQQAEIDLRQARLLELTNGARSAEIERAKAAADQAYLNWQMLKNGSRSEDIGMAGAQRQEAERQLALLETGYRREDVEQAKAQMDEKKVRLQWAERDYERYKGLAVDGAVSSREAEEMKTKMEESRSAFEAAAKNYAKYLIGPRREEILAARERVKFAQQRERLVVAGPRSEQIGMSWQQYMQAKAVLDLLSEGTRHEQISQSKAALAEAQAALAELDAQLEDRLICSPADAEVSVMDLHKGQILPANKPILKLTRLDTLWMRVYIPERELSSVHMGQKVALKADSYPGRTFYGKIVQIPSTAEFTPRNIQTSEERASQVFGLKVSIDNQARLLRGGMNAEITLPASPACSMPIGGLAKWPP